MISTPASRPAWTAFVCGTRGALSRTPRAFRPWLSSVAGRCSIASASPCPGRPTSPRRHRSAGMGWDRKTGLVGTEVPGLPGPASLAPDERNYPQRALRSAAQGWRPWTWGLADPRGCTARGSGWWRPATSRYLPRRHRGHGEGAGAMCRTNTRVRRLECSAAEAGRVPRSHEELQDTKKRTPPT